MIFQNYIAGMSLQSAARAAGHPMAHSTVRRMLQRKMLPWRCFLSGNSGQRNLCSGKCRVAASCRCNATTWKNEGESPYVHRQKFLLELPQQIPGIRWKYAISAGRISLSFDTKQGVMQQCQRSLQFHPESKEIML